MNDEAAFTQAMQERPDDTTIRLVFADWLEEQGDPRGELIRLLHTLTQSVEVPDRKKLEKRLRSLVSSEVKPVGPFWTNSLGMKFAWVPAGTFLMGSPANEKERGDDETQHRVTLTKGLYLAIHPVTQACWQDVMGNNPSDHPGDDLPVERVSWEESGEFLRKLSEREGRAYRLPTEAEWEYACRAGTTTPSYFGGVISTDEASCGVYRDGTTPVGSFSGNAWALHDMHGNVWEWCRDWHGLYVSGDAVDPQGAPEGERRVLRGGYFGSHAITVRSALRYGFVPSCRLYSVGFRAAVSASP